MISLVRTLFSLVALAIATVVASQAVAADEKRLALTVGIQAYRNVDKLERSANDARAVSEAMGKIGFDVTSVIDVNHADLLKALDDFGDKIGKGDTAFLFVAAQAVNVGGVDYVFATDATVTDKRHLAEHGVTIDQILAKLRKNAPGRIVLVIDGCRNDPFAVIELDSKSKSPPAAKGVTADSSGGDVFVLFSAGLGQEAFEAISSSDRDPNSLFTRHFIKAVGKPGQTLNDLTRNLRDDVFGVARSANIRQLPIAYGTIPDYVLVPAAR